MKVKKVGDIKNNELDYKESEDILRDKILNGVINYTNEENKDLYLQNNIPEFRKSSSKKFYLIFGGIIFFLIIVTIIILVISNNTILMNNKESIKNINKVDTTKSSYITNSDSNSVKFIPSYFKGYANDTEMELFIENVQGNNFYGYNIIYWNANNGLKTKFNGFYDNNNKIVIYEPKDVKKAGQFEGILSENGNLIEGFWTRYSDNGSYKWSLKKTEYKEPTRIDFKDFINEFIRKSKQSGKEISKNCSKSILMLLYEDNKYIQKSSSSMIPLISDDLKNYTKMHISNNILTLDVRDVTVRMYFSLDSESNWLLYKYEATP